MGLASMYNERSKHNRTHMAKFNDKSASTGKLRSLRQLAVGVLNLTMDDRFMNIGAELRQVV